MKKEQILKEIEIALSNLRSIQSALPDNDIARQAILAFNYASKYITENPEVEESYNRGLNDAWELARKIICDRDGDFGLTELDSIFDKTIFNYIFKDNTYEQALAKVKEYEKSIHKKA